MIDDELPPPGAITQVAEQIAAEVAAMSEAQLLEALKDPQWRLSHLYWIIDKDNNRTIFVPNEHQQKLFQSMWWRNIILKARQLGFSTAIQILMLDTCLFEPNTHAAVIAQDQEASTVIFRKIRFAYDNLPAIIFDLLPLMQPTESPKRDAASELILRNNSTLRVATSVRSATLQFLHISEFGKICAKYPDKAQEIVTGSLPAAEKGVIFIESTAEGREGKFYEMSNKAQGLSQKAGHSLSRYEYRFHFAGWWDWPEYRAPRDSVAISGVEHDYFNKTESIIGRAIDNEQRAWYIATRDNVFSGDWQLMKQEYPSTPAEAFEQSQDGVHYAAQLAAARRQGRITNVPYDPRVPVNTFWDLGKDDDTAIWFHQHINGWDNWIDYYECSDQAFSHYALILQEKGYVYKNHYIPHDGAHRQWGAKELKTSEDLLHDVGVKPTIVVPQTPNLGIGIRQTRDAFALYRFDETNCKEGVIHLENYRKPWNARLGAWGEGHLKNGHQHAADAIRQHAQVFQPPATAPRKRRKRASGMAA